MLKRLFLWEYRRGGWQYDVMVGVIVAFIFLTPRDWFRDHPRVANFRSIAKELVWIDKERLAGTPAENRVARAEEILRSSGVPNGLSIARVEPVLDSEGELQGYVAFARP